MVEKNITVMNSEGLHTRPANQFVKLVKQYKSTVQIQKNGKEAPGTSLLKIMKLGVVQGDDLIVRCEGPDEEAAMASIEALLAGESLEVEQ